jgi:hypothetical protein
MLLGFVEKSSMLSQTPQHRILVNKQKVRTHDVIDVLPAFAVNDLHTAFFVADVSLNVSIDSGEVFRSGRQSCPAKKK